MHFKVSASAPSHACYVFKGGSGPESGPAGPEEPQGLSSECSGGFKDELVPPLDQEPIWGDQLLAARGSADLVLCSLQTLISQSHACVCQGEELQRPLLLESFCPVLSSSDPSLRCV